VGKQELNRPNTLVCCYMSSKVYANFCSQQLINLSKS